MSSRIPKAKKQTNGSTQGITTAKTRFSSLKSLKSHKNPSLKIPYNSSKHSPTTSIKRHHYGSINTQRRVVVIDMGVKGNKAIVMIDHNNNNDSQTQTISPSPTTPNPLTKRKLLIKKSHHDEDINNLDRLITYKLPSTSDNDTILTKYKKSKKSSTFLHSDTLFQHSPTSSLTSSNGHLDQIMSLDQGDGGIGPDFIHLDGINDSLLNLLMNDTQMNKNNKNVKENNKNVQEKKNTTITTTTLKRPFTPHTRPTPLTHHHRFFSTTTKNCGIPFASGTFYGVVMKRGKNNTQNGQKGQNSNQNGQYESIFHTKKAPFASKQRKDLNKPKSIHEQVAYAKQLEMQEREATMEEAKQTEIDELISRQNAHNEQNNGQNDQNKGQNGLKNAHSVKNAQKNLTTSPQVVSNLIEMTDLGQIDDPVENLTPVIIDSLDNLFTTMISHHQKTLLRTLQTHYPNHPTTPSQSASQGPNKDTNSTPNTKKHGPEGEQMRVEDGYNFATLFSHIYPIQHKPINETTPIVVLSTVTFQHYIASTFNLIEQYKDYLADPENNPLPSTIHQKIHSKGPKMGQNEQNGIKMTQNSQVCTPRSLAVATFTNYPIVTFENMGLSPEALAFACGFSHEHIPVEYKCLGAVKKQKFYDDVGVHIRHSLKKGLPSHHAGTTGKATTDDLDRWVRAVGARTAEAQREIELKRSRDDFYEENGQNDENNENNGQNQFVGRYQGHLVDSENKDGKTNHSNHNEVDPVDHEVRLLKQREQLELKSHEKIIRSMVSQRLYDLGVKVVVMVDDVVETRHENFFKLLHSYLLHSFQSIDGELDLKNIHNNDNFIQLGNKNNNNNNNNFIKTLNNNPDNSTKTASNTTSTDSTDIMDAYSFSGDLPSKNGNNNNNTDNNNNHNNNIDNNNNNNNTIIPSNPNILTKLSQTQLRIAMKKLYTHFLHTTLPENNHYDENGNFRPDLTIHTDKTPSKSTNLAHLNANFNPQYTQSFFEWLMGFGMHPGQFKEHTESLVPHLLQQILHQTDKTLSNTPNPSGNGIIPNDFRGEIAAYINSTVDMIKGLHLNSVDGVLYSDIITNSKSGGVYSLLLKQHLLTKKQERRTRQHRYQRNAIDLAQKNRAIMKKRLGGNDQDGWDSFSDDENSQNSENDEKNNENGQNSDYNTDNDSDDLSGEDDSIDDDDSDDQEEIEQHIAAGNGKKMSGKNGQNGQNGQKGVKNEQNDQIDPKTASLLHQNDLTVTQIKSQSFDSLILHHDNDNMNDYKRVHIGFDGAEGVTSLKNRILRKENVIFGPLIGVDFVNGIARTKRLRGSFDQRSPLIQAVLGARNAIKATPNTRNPLLPVNENYAILKFQSEQQETLINSDLAALSVAPGVNNIRELLETTQGQKGDKLLPFWEQLDLEQSQFDQNLSSYIGSSSSSGVLNTQAQHLLSHYEAVDRDTPLGEIVPVATLHQRQISQQEAKRVSQLKHLKLQQETKELRQKEWLEVVLKHVQSGNAQIVDDVLESLAIADGDGGKVVESVGDSANSANSANLTKNTQNHPNNHQKDPNGSNSSKNAPPQPETSLTSTLSSIRSIPAGHTSLTQHFTTDSSSVKAFLLPFDPDLPPLPENGVILPSEKKKYVQESVDITYHVRSETKTTLYKQQRIYSENSAYIVRYYSHDTTIIKTPQLDTIDDSVLQRLDMGDITTQTDNTSTTTTTVSRLLRVCDVTGGFGTDSFILASSVNQNKDLELEINMVEGDKVLYTLLSDGIRRAQQVHRYDNLNVPEFKLVKTPGMYSNPGNSKNNKGKNGKNGPNHNDSSTLSSFSRSSKFNSGFEMDDMYGDNDSDDDDRQNGQNGGENDENGGENDENDENGDEFDPDSYLNANNDESEQAAVISSLRRDRYFPHSKVTLPKIHGLDLNDPGVQKKLSKTGKYGSSAADLHFEKMMKQQQRIVELAEKTLKDYIEGGLGDDAVPVQNKASQGDKPDNVARMNGVPLQQGQGFSSRNPLLRNKMLSQQHIAEVSLIAQRMKVVYGNSLEYLARSHFRVPGYLTMPGSQGTMVGKERNLKTIFSKIQKKLDQGNSGVQLSSFLTQLETIPALVKGSKMPFKEIDHRDVGGQDGGDENDHDSQNDGDENDNNTNTSQDDVDEDLAVGENYDNDVDSDDPSQNQPKVISIKPKRSIKHESDLSIVLDDVKIFDSNPHLSPVLNPHYPYPTYTSQVASVTHRAYDVVYLDPFYPVKNKGKRAKYKMLQRNSKFMSFAKSLQDVYQHQELNLSMSRNKTNAMLSRLIDFVMEKEEMREVSMFGQNLGAFGGDNNKLGQNHENRQNDTKNQKHQNQQNQNDSKKTNKKDKNTADNNPQIKSLLNQTIPSLGSGSHGFNDKDGMGLDADMVRNMEDIVVDFQHISSKLSLLHSVSQEIDITYNERANNSKSTPTMGKPVVDLQSLRHYQEKNLPILTTNDQYAIYSALITTLQGLLGDSYENSIFNSSSINNNSSNSTIATFSSKKTASRLLKSQIKLGKQLCQLYISLYSISPQLLPLYTNAMLTVTQPITPNIVINEDGEEEEHQYAPPIFIPYSPHTPTTPINSTNTSNSLILTREPENTHLLFDAARITASRRVVLKRPIYAPVLHKAQTVSLVDNKTRFDVITPLSSVSYTNRVLWSILNRARERYNSNYNYQSIDRDWSSQWQNEQQIASQSQQSQQSILCYDSNVPQPMYNSKLNKRSAKLSQKNGDFDKQQTFLRPPHLPYLAFTTFSSGGNNNNNSTPGTEGNNNNTTMNENNSMLQSINRQRQIKLEKKRAEDKVKQQIRKQKRKNKR